MLGFLVFVREVLCLLRYYFLCIQFKVPTTSLFLSFRLGSAATDEILFASEQQSECIMMVKAYPAKSAKPSFGQSIFPSTSLKFPPHHFSLISPPPFSPPLSLFPSYCFSNPSCSRQSFDRQSHPLQRVATTCSARTKLL